MNKFGVLIHVNNNPGTNYISKCGNYVIDEDRKNIIFQQGFPVVAVSFKGIPDNIEWEMKR